MSGAEALAPGDLVELKLAEGFGYALVTHRHPAYPEVVRPLGPRRAERPADLAGLMAEAGPARLFPLGGALAHGRLSGAVIAHLTPPAAFAAFPRFRTPIRDRRGAPIYWWLWDGAGVAPVADDAALEGTPLREVLSPEGFAALF